MSYYKKLRVWYTDMWGHGDYVFNPHFSYFTLLLSLRYDVLITPDEPDVLIFSCFGTNHLHYSNCIKIFFCGENSSPPGVERMIKPDYRFCDLSLSQFPDTSQNYYLPLWVLFVNWFKQRLPLPLPSNPTFLVEPEALLSSRPTYQENKQRFCCFINNNPVADRIHLFTLLAGNHIVDSYGKLYNNVGYLLGGDESAKHHVLQKTSFTIAYENSYAFGYNTEKIIQPYSRGSIAIYSGGLDRSIFNSKAIFYNEDYVSTEDMVDDIVAHSNCSHLMQAKIAQPLFISDQIPSRFEPITVLGWLEEKIGHFRSF